MKEFYAEKAYTATKNTIIGKFKVSDFVNSLENQNCKSAWINVGGWQSWNPGFEIPPGETQDKLKCHVIYQFNRYLTMPESNFRENKNQVLGHFIIYLRWDDFYLIFASCGNLNQTLPPVQFVINRKENSVEVELCDKGKEWDKGELQAQIKIFTAESYFELRDKLENIFGSSDKNSKNYTARFNQIEFLGKTSLGWESWYNHYSKIHEKLILEDLQSLNTTENFLKITDKTAKPVFQIDDGWEKQLGNWEIDNKKFPHGLEYLTAKISEAGYIPGLWIAPFIIDLRSPVAQAHPDWLLRNLQGHLIPAGFNPLWGSNCTFYALDLSNDEVLEYLDSILDKIVNQWNFRYIKLDFLYAGMFFAGFKNKGAAYEWYTRAINKLTSRKTNNKGESVAYLGCGAPFEMSFKLLPLSRIGCDTFENWENKLSKFLRINGRNSAFLNLKDTIGHAFWDKIIFANDPDVIFIRNENCSLTKNEKLLIATINILFGSQLMYSDDPSKSNSIEEIELAKEINEIRNKYKNEIFSVKNISKNKFQINSRSGKFSGEINLGKEHYIKIFEK